MNSTSLCSLAGRYDNPIPTRFLAPIDCLKMPALNGVVGTWTKQLCRHQSKILSSEKFTCKETLRQVFICLRPPPLLLPHTPPPPYTLYTCILIHTGKGVRGGDLTREQVRRTTVHKAGSKILSVTDPVFQGSNLSNRYEDDR